MLKTLTVIRNILLRSFAISVVYAFIAIIFCLAGHNFVVSMISSVYKISPDQVHFLIVQFIASIKLFVLLVLLFPALAIHWTIISMRKIKK